MMACLLRCRLFAVEIAELGEPVIRDIVKLLVKRIKKEMAELPAAEQKINIIISKCWNIIKVMVELETFVPKYLRPIEQELLTLFEFL